MRQGTSLETIQNSNEMRLLQNQQGPQGPFGQNGGNGENFPLTWHLRAPAYVQVLIKNADGSYSVGGIE